jgi:hypothetical protein
MDWRLIIEKQALSIWSFVIFLNATSLFYNEYTEHVSQLRFSVSFERKTNIYTFNNLIDVCETQCLFLEWQ